MPEEPGKPHYFFSSEEEYKNLAEAIVKKSVEKGAGQAEVYLQWGLTSEFQIRIGKPESIKQASSKGLGLRVFKNGRQGFVSTTDFSPVVIDNVIDQAVQLAGISGEDEFFGLPESIGNDVRELEVFDPASLEMVPERKLELALEMEEAAFAVDSRIKNSEGSSFQNAVGGTIIANSNSVLKSYHKSRFTLVCAPVVQQGDEKRYGFWFSSGTHFKGLEGAEAIGRKAGERAVRMLGAKKIKTQKAPVIFDPLIAGGFISTIMSCVNGEARNKKETCFWDKSDVTIASELVTIFDDGSLKGETGAIPFDGEGVPSGRKSIIQNGKLTNFLYDSYSSRKGGTVTTGNGLRSYKSMPSIQGTNFYLENGKVDPESIIKSVKNGLYVTGLMGFGINIVNGNYSRGAEGIRIENGELTYPVHEVTISGNILDILRDIEAVGNDLRMVGTASAPTILIREMMISGK